MKSYLRNSILLILVQVLLAPVHAEVLTAKEIKERVSAKYSSLDGLVITGQLIQDTDMSGFDFSCLLGGSGEQSESAASEVFNTSFSALVEIMNRSDFILLLSRTGDFKLKSTGLAGYQHQAAWSLDGETCLLMMNRYSKTDRNQAIQMFGTSFLSTVPSLFYGMNSLRISDLWKWERLEDESVGDNDCYVLLQRDSVGTEHQIWIGKEDMFLVQERVKLPSGSKMRESMESGDMPLSDEMFGDALEVMGEDGVSDLREIFKENLRDSVDVAPEGIPDSTITVHYSGIEIRVPERDEMEYQLSEGAVYVEDLFSLNQ